MYLICILCELPRIQGNKIRCSAPGGGDRDVNRSFPGRLITARAWGGAGCDGDTDGDIVPGGPRSASQGQRCLRGVSQVERAYSEPVVELNRQFSYRNNGSWEIKCMLFV